jgi:formamidopyrimidine-DNA glycosylase
MVREDMPELPEVEATRIYLEATALLQPIRSAVVKDKRILSGVTPKALEFSLAGEQFLSAQRHGKRLFLKLQDDLWLTLHLGLTGSLVYLQAGDDEPGHTRLQVSF